MRPPMAALTALVLLLAAAVVGYISTGAWQDGSGFPETFPAVTPDAADALVLSGVRLVGTDAPSVDPFASAELPAHQRLLAAGIPILENLLLDDVPEGRYELIALPLKLMALDAAPVRAVLRDARGARLTGDE